MTKKMREYKQLQWKALDQQARALYRFKDRRDEAKAIYAQADALKQELTEGR